MGNSLTIPNEENADIFNIRPLPIKQLESIKKSRWTPKTVMQPTYTYRYTCANKHCGETHIFNSSKPLGREMTEVFCNHHKYVCSNNFSKSFTRRPTHVMFHSQRLSMHVCYYTRCEHCGLQHKAIQSDFIAMNKAMMIPELTKPCVKCNTICTLRQASCATQ